MFTYFLSSNIFLFHVYAQNSSQFEKKVADNYKPPAPWHILTAEQDLFMILIDGCSRRYTDNSLDPTAALYWLPRAEKCPQLGVSTTMTTSFDCSWLLLQLYLFAQISPLPKAKLPH